MASSTASDGFVYPKGLYYQVDVSGGTPTLLQQGVIDPGAGVAVQMPSVDEDTHGSLGLTWMESSNSEYLSMWVATLLKPVGKLATADAAPGGGFFYANFRIGDYGTTVLDLSNGRTFWTANEYIGADGATDIWRTHLASLSVLGQNLNTNQNTTVGLTSASKTSGNASEFINSGQRSSAKALVVKDGDTITVVVNGGRQMDVAASNGH